MACTKKNDLMDGDVIPLPQSPQPQPPSPSQFTAAAAALWSTAARVAAAATSVLTSPSKTFDITADAPHDNAFMVDPNLEEINYEEEEEDDEVEEEDEDRDFFPNKDLYKSNLLDSDDDNVSPGLSVPCSIS